MSLHLLGRSQLGSRGETGREAGRQKAEGVEASIWEGVKGKVVGEGTVKVRVGHVS